MTDLRYTAERVLAVKQWVPGKLFSIRTTRSPEFSFKPGQFARLGLPATGTDSAAAEPTIWRGFSMVNEPDADYLEFYAVVVPEGEFSPQLAQLQEGDTLYVDKTAFGFLTLDNFPNGGESLWLLATGTGLSAYLSMLKQEQTWNLFSKVILCHGVRHIEELNYQEDIQACQDKFAERFVYLPLPTRQAYQDYPQARLTELIQDNRLAELAQTALDPEKACIMLCGNPDMLSDARKILGDKGFATGRRGNIGNLAVEKYW